jgi:hypothetical protein
MLQLVGPSLLVFQGLQVLEKAVEVDADSDRFPENWIFHQRWHRKPGKLDGKLLSVYTNCSLLWSYFCKGPVDECALQADNE